MYSTQNFYKKREKELLELINQHANTITKLSHENRDLKEKHAVIIAQKESLQDEMLKQSDYILSIQEKYYQTSKQLVHLISHLKDQENEIEALPRQESEDLTSEEIAVWQVSSYWRQER